METQQTTPAGSKSGSRSPDRAGRLAGALETRKIALVEKAAAFAHQTLDATIAEMGADRVLFSTDYPYESMREAADWFDNAAINDNDRVKIGRSNSEELFRLKQLVAA